ncbi:MAG TPA: acetoacetate--CoA ligase [Polyangiaceae bacterium]|nr:acetoacetate--CoA ligase [Polyangiaceae bacterium]
MARAEGELLFEPSPERVRASRLTEFAVWLGARTGRSFASYDELWRYSVTDLPGFWSALSEFFRVRFHTQPRAVLEGTMPAAHWFPGATLSYAEHALRAPDADPALVFRAEDGRRVAWSFGELKEQVARARAGLLRLGVQKGDRVAALLPNRPETVALFLATASLGAIWSSSAPEFGVPSILDRFRQIEPRVFITVDGYRYGGKAFDRSADVRAIAAALPGSPAVVVLPELGVDVGIAGAISFAELTAERGELAFEPVPFEHPLWILYSSGTTGLPKPIVQGHGGILLEHLKALALHGDLKPGERFFWFSTTGWMMWNYLVSGLCLGVTLVLYDGSPAYPGLDALWKLVESERITTFGTSAPYLLACQKGHLAPGTKHDLSALSVIGTTGAPLPADGFGWVYDQVKRDLVLASVSGGTDVCTAFVLACPWLPVHAGEIQCRGLGAKVEAFDPSGNAVIDEVGELVLTEPLPSMPVGFWGDADGSRFRESYFSVYPGVWRHGDWIKITPRGSCVIYGRSDSTLNRGGVRMGTSEFYRVVEALPEIADSLVVDTGSLEGDAIGKLWLFVVLAPGRALDRELEKRVKERVKLDLSPRHVPDKIVAVRAIPRTINGKKLEVPVKRILLGTAPEKAASRDTLADPSSLDAFVELARGGVA